MELRHLKYFLAVAEELHFSRAAEKLHMAQPPLSQQIRVLEAELGVQLFERTRRKVQLTEAGRVFFEEGQRAMAHLEQAVRSTQRAARGESGRLAVGFNSSAAYSVLPAILRAYRQRFAEVELVLRELTTDRQLSELRDGRIDVGFLYLPVEDPALRCEPLLSEPLVVAVGEFHPLAGERSLGLEAVADEPLIINPRADGRRFYDLVTGIFEQAGFKPRIAQEAVLTQTIVSLVAGGVGIALLPASARQFQRAGVVYRPLSEQTPPLEVAVAWRAEPPAVVREFVRVAREIVTAALAAGQSV
ncbi:LysR family transcriptional regulator [Gloeobacter morelensis]|uniref:LysR family transcriptional regulator n=1 Tax=Gloeobacter morelensis MG652769 TaxID=2781736 RepID=A0ABY3PP47_9CYAN|nr:LysR family transcriptional regulator [Gloeobacter morelensis]UFP95389.1 LysR family transcriptional regulator [Gloeobacter morelensis MG652769]